MSFPGSLRQTDVLFPPLPNLDLGFGGYGVSRASTGGASSAMPGLVPVAEPEQAQQRPGFIGTFFPAAWAAGPGPVPAPAFPAAYAGRTAAQGPGTSASFGGGAWVAGPGQVPAPAPAQAPAFRSFGPPALFALPGFRPALLARPSEAPVAAAAVACPAPAAASTAGAPFPANFRFAVTAVAGAAPAVAGAAPAVAPPVEPGSVGFVRGALDTDLQIARLSELRRISGLGRVSVDVTLRRLRETAHAEGYHSLESLTRAISELVHPMPSLQAVQEVFEFFDFDGNGRIDALELIGGCALLSAGTEEQKLEAGFHAFDVDGDGFISMDEMYKFLVAVFRVVLSGQVIAAMKTLSVNVEGAEDLAAATAIECFKAADLNDDGKLSIAEFKTWLGGGMSGK